MNISKQELKFFSFLSIPILLTLLGFIFVRTNIIFAQDSNTEISYDIKKAVFGIDTQQERYSRKPKILSIKKGRTVYKVLTTETDVYQILKQYKIDISGKEKIIINTPYILNGTFITLIQTETIVENILLDIPFSTETKKSNMLAEGEKKIVQEGVLGKKRVIVQSYYEDGILKDSVVLAESIVTEPVKKIYEIGTSIYSLEGIELRGYNCPYWYSVVDSGPYSNEEKEWLKFIMYCESGCNAEHNKSIYKGLFQWNPKWWKKQFSENIFDGHAQIKNTITKYRAGESTRKNQWPACHAKFLSESGN